MKIYKNVLLASLLISGLTSCSESWLKPDPLSFYEPATTFKTKEGLEAAMVTLDRHSRHYWANDGEVGPICTSYTLSDLYVNGTTDQNRTFESINMVDMLSDPGSTYQDNAGGTRVKWFWVESYSGIKYANTIISSLPNVEGLSDALYGEMMGRALYHRAWRYMHLVFQFGDVPLLTEEVSAPKFDYYSTKMNVIIDKVVEDLKYAVEHLPAVSEHIGMPNKGTARHLYIKALLAQGEFQEAVDQANILIDQSGYALMTEPFGTFVNPMPGVHNITRNVIWDLHRPENKGIAMNTEVIHFTVNREEFTDSRSSFKTMRNFTPCYFEADGSTKGILTPDKKYGMDTGRGTEYDYRKTYGRGLARVRPVYYAEKSGWLGDEGDLRRDVETGNFMEMENFKYNHSQSKTGENWYGKNIMKYNEAGDILCLDTIRDWFGWPHYKVWIEDPRAEAVDTYEGGVADWYVYRLAETYLLRAEAHMWLGEKGKAAEDVNAVRRRAHCEKLFTADEMNMGVIMDERFRELFMEEFRHDELCRVSYIFAKTGKTDEFGRSYTIENLPLSSYWYSRVQKYNHYYMNKTKTRSGNNYDIATFHVFYPVPQGAIDGNREGVIKQNYGYIGYNANDFVYDNLEDALAGQY